VNSKQRRTLEAVWSDPVNGNIEWARIESFHPPRPDKEALRYRVKAVRELLERMGTKP
jgi:hypothetical protein